MGRLVLRPETWIRMRLRWSGGWLEVWSDDVLQGRFTDRDIASGYCFIGLKGGTIALNSISLEQSTINILSMTTLCNRASLSRKRCLQPSG